MSKVKKELGSEAVILQTRQYKVGGFLGFFAKQKVEITAAVEDVPVYKKKAAEKVPGAAETRSEQDAFLLRQEIGDMKKMLKIINKQMEELGEEKTVWPLPFQPWAEMLLERGMTESLVRRIILQIQQNLLKTEWHNEAKVRTALEEIVSRMCSNTAAIEPGSGKPRVVALVGPTGVGKTTTIGKLAAGFKVIDNRRVALITVDTYRVAAVEQLKTFGELIGVSVEVATTPSGLREALNRHADKELIFIDTSGRSPQHYLHMSELRAFLDKACPDLTILVMSATTQIMDQLRVLKSFESFSTHLIFTKLDETVSAGSILNLLEQTNLPTAYITNGQNVPDDIEVATLQRLVSYILEKGNSYV
jgi:flagellar biosynthesis protein FlhF